LQNGPPVAVLSGAGLYVQDDDHNEIYLMKRATVQVVTETSDFASVVLTANYLSFGVDASYQNGVLNLEGDASVSEYQQMLRSITFDIETDEPDLSPRRIMFRIFDGIQWSEPAYVTITIEAINDHAPIVELTPRNESFVEQSDGVGLLDNATLTDRDHPERFNITGAHINITGFCDSTMENITVDVPPGSTIVVDRQGPCLVLSGSDTLENYRQTILTARYINNADEPDDTDREIVFTVFDGNSSGSDSIILRILTQDDNPTMVCIHVTRQPEPYSHS